MLIWGPVPLMNNKYWSNAMREMGWNSKTLMRGYYSTYKKEDYDLYFEDLIPSWIPKFVCKYSVMSCFAMLYVIRNGKVFHMSFQGGPFGQTAYWRIEAYLLHWAGIRTVVIPYGSDAYMYSRIIDPVLRHAVLLSYPMLAKQEGNIAKRVRYWIQQADIVIAGIMIDGIGRWDVCTHNTLCINTAEWRQKTYYSLHNGQDGIVKVMHTPNHRGFKGTEFLAQVIKELQAEGLKVELVLLENVPNRKVRELMQEVDILAEQFIFSGYALSGIEGMASGLPVLANLDQETYTRIFRRYAFLNECPILSATVETLKANLRTLITNPKLRQELGQAGRQFVEKYHSYETAQYLFGSIYDKILYRKDVDLMNLFHPLKSEYNKATPFIKHPLIENHLPERYVYQQDDSHHTSNILPELSS